MIGLIAVAAFLVGLNLGLFLGAKIVFDGLDEETSSDRIGMGM